MLKLWKARRRRDQGFQAHEAHERAEQRHVAAGFACLYRRQGGATDAARAQSGLALLHQQSHLVCCWIMQSCSQCGHAALLIDAPCNHLRCAKRTQVVGVLSTWEGLHECSRVGSSEPLSIQFDGQLQGPAGLVYRIELRKEEVPYFAYVCVKCRRFYCMAALMHVQYERDVVYLYFCMAKFLLARLLPDS